MNISEIAKLAGVSKSAVSRYLNQGYLSEEKRERIAQVVAQTGYKPSSQAQGLRVKRTNLIGVVLPKIDSETIGQIVSGLGSTLREAGYQLLLADTENNPKRELESLETFQYNLVDGIVLIATVLTPQHQKLIRNLRIPLVIVGQQHDSAPSIYHNDFDAARALMALMLEKGRTRPGYIGVTQQDIAAGKRRLEGFEAALLQYGITVPKMHRMVSRFSMKSGYEQAQALLSRFPEMDCLFCATDNIAAGAIQYLQEAGRRVPEDVMVTGIGDSRIGSVMTPTLTTAHYFYRASGEEAAQMILRMLAREHTVLPSVQMSYQLVRRASTGD